MCPSNDIFDKNKKQLMLVLGPHSKDLKSTRDKADIGNPKVNRGCPPLTANHTSADCLENSLGPSVQYIPLGVYHTGGFQRYEMQVNPSKFQLMVMNSKLNPGPVELTNDNQVIQSVECF